MTPKAYAVTHTRMNPVTRDKAVETVMIAVDRATVGVEIATSQGTVY